MLHGGEPDVRAIYIGFRMKFVRRRNVQQFENGSMLLTC
jgi:hypothetical protein